MCGSVFYKLSYISKRIDPPDTTMSFFSNQVKAVTAIEKFANLLHPYYFDNPDNSVSPWELGKIDVYEFPERPLD